MIKFNKEEFQRTLSSTIKLKVVSKNPEDQSIILYRDGKYDIKTRTHTPLQFKKLIPFQSACFQLTNRLYVCGGERQLQSGIQYLSSIFETDSKGISQNLSSMEKSRCALSLSGIGQTLIAIGGFNGKNLRTSEEFQINVNKWKRIHPLKVARQWPGSCVLKSMRAYCFCGGIANGDHNSIETTELDKKKEWQLLAISDEIARTYHLAAVPLGGQIIVFGGQYDGTSCMYVLTEHGDLLKDLSNDPLIPGYMCSTAAVVSNGKVYTIGQRAIEGKWQWRAQQFDGRHWAYL